MRWPLALFSMMLLALTAGCRSNNTGLLESELHARELDVEALRAKLRRAHLYNQALEQEIQAYTGGGTGHPLAVYPVESLVLGRGTAGTHNDHCGGDDGLEVHLEPRDPEGHAIKVPGSVLVEAVQIDSQGLKSPLSTWEIPPEVLRRSWRQGLFTTGYRLKLRWKVWPTTEKLRITARFKTRDGRLFEAARDITIRLPPRPAHSVPAKSALTPSKPASDPTPETIPPAKPVKPPGDGTPPATPKQLPPPQPVPPSQPPGPALEPVLPLLPPPTILEHTQVHWRATRAQPSPD